MEHKAVGKHLILDLFEIREVNDEDFPYLFADACRDAGATVLGFNVHEFGDECGTTGVIILAESHCSWHHYPESKTIFIDLFTCGDTVPQRAMDRITDFFKPGHLNQWYLTRGQ